MKETFNAIRVALFFIIGIALIWVVYVTLGRKEFRSENGYHIVAVFDDMSTLSPESDVRIAGVKVGRVAETDLVNGKGQAVLAINTKYKEIPVDSVATVSMGNLLGQNYVDIKYGDPATGFLAEGDQIATKPAASISAVLEQINTLGEKLNTFADSLGGMSEGPGQLFDKVDQLIEDNRSKIEQILDDLSVTTGNLREGKGTLGKLLNSEEAHDELLAAVREIRAAAEDARATFTDAQSVIAQIESGQGTLGKLLYDDAIAARIDETVVNLQAFSQKLNEGDGTLGKLVNDDTIYRELRALLNQAEQSLSSMSDSGPVSAVGAAAGALF